MGNRLRLREDLEVLAGQVERYRHGYCAVMCDVDSFKAYNDHYRHIAGDEVLRAIATTITQSCRANDLVYRYGGEEFLLILPKQSLEAAMIVAERSRQAVEQLRLAHAAKTPAGVVTLSAGVAMLEPGSGQAISDWLRNADTALYRAKAAGRNCVVPFKDACEPREKRQR